MVERGQASTLVLLHIRALLHHEVPILAAHLNLIISKRPHLQIPSNEKGRGHRSIYKFWRDTSIYSRQKVVSNYILLKLWNFLHGVLQRVGAKQIRNMYRYVDIIMYYIWLVFYNKVISILAVWHDSVLWVFGGKATFVQRWSWSIAVSLPMVEQYFCLPSFYTYSLPSMFKVSPKPEEDGDQRFWLHVED